MRRDLKWLLVLLLSLTLWAVGCDDDGGGGGDEDTDAVTDTENDNGDVEGDTDQINEIEDTDTIDDTDTDTDVVDPEIVVCDNVIPTPSSGTCEVTEGDTSLLLEGTVLAGQTIYQNGRVVVDNTNGSGRITCVGCDCEAPSATRVSCPEGVISPGLINTHDHITFCELAPADHGSERYEHRHDWRKGLRGHTRLSTPGQDEVRWGEVRMLLSGVTSITGSGGSDGLIRNLDKSNSVNADVDYRTFPLGDSDGTQLSSGCGYPSIDSESRAAGAGIYHAHISEGIDGVTRNEFACTSSSQNGGHDLVNGNTSIVHGVGLSASDIQHIADEGAKLIWSPRSNVDLYGNTAPILLYKNLGVTISLGTDWAASGSMNMLRELQCADYLNTNHYNNAFTDFDLFMMATYNGAVATGTDTSLGLIANGYLGDISIYAAKGRSPYRAVIDADIQDVTLVMRGGYTLYGDTAVVQGLMGSTASQCDSMDVCDSDKLLCISPDTGETLSALEGSVASDAYGLFYCGIPMNEPSCEPFRGNEYPSSDPNDMDGDGIADADDNCPNVFNPIRPVIDGGVQPDADSDGEGDACDICPFNEGSVCDAPTPGDRDRDGTPDLEDNCPSTPNEDQADGDEDGIGDVCDPCPEDYSPAGQACPATIYQIKTGEMPMGNSAAISGAVVTAVAGNGVFVQVDPDSADYEGIDNSGIFIYFGSGSSYTAERGDVVNASGSIDAFFDQIQLSNLTSFEVVSSGPLIAPHVVSDPSTIATGGSAQAALEGVLVTVTDVTVTDIAPAPGYDGHNTANEFLVTGGLRIADYFYAVEPFPELDAHFDSITGVLHWGNSVSNLEPRDIFDVISGPPAVDHIEPAYGYLLEGDTASPLPGMTLYMNRPMDEDTTVTLSYGDDSVLTGPATVLVPEGVMMVELELTGVAASTTPASVTASFGGVDAMAEVRVYDNTEEREVAAIDPADADDHRQWFGDLHRDPQHPRWHRRSGGEPQRRRWHHRSG